MSTDTMPPRSFFVGPTAFWKGRERRRPWRWLLAIILKGNTEPQELGLVLAVLLTSASVFGGGGLVSSRTHVDALIYLALAGIGFAGLAYRSYELRATFAFVVAVLRFYGFIYFFAQAPPAGLVWPNYAIATVICTWIYLRIVCRRAVHLQNLKRSSYDE